MRGQDLKADDYRPSFSGHETFPLRYGWLQKAYRAVSQAATPKDAIQVFRNADAIARFGVGRNMVGSIRYWALGSGIIEENKEGLVTTWLGDMLFGQDAVDLYLEEEASLWLIHWYLASRTRLTSIYWLFNEFRGGDFVKTEIVSALLKLSHECAWLRVAENTVDRDIQCLLRAYIGGRGSGEAGDSLLSELALIRPLDKYRSRLSRGRQNSLPDSVFLYCLNEFWANNATAQATMSFENIAYSPGSPGRVFLMNEDDIILRLERLEAISRGKLVWSETAGLRQIISSEEISIEQEQTELNRWLLSLRDQEVA